MSTKTTFKLAYLCILAPALVAGVAQLGSPAPDFTIKDQYEHEVQLSSQRGKLVLLIYGDRLGSDYMGAWARAIGQSPVAPSVNVLRIANLRVVPSMFYSYVKKQFRKPNSDGKPSSPVLLDWDGTVAKAYGFTDDLTNVYLIDQNGVLRYVACGKGTPTETGKLLEMVTNLGRNEEATN